MKRISGDMYVEVQGTLKVFLEKVIKDAVVYTEHGIDIYTHNLWGTDIIAMICVVKIARRKTVSTLDVLYSLKRNGRTLWGFGA